MLGVRSKTPISHWTAGRFCNGCLGGGAGQHESGSPSFSIIHRGGSARSFHVEGTRIADIAPVIRANLAREPTMMPDEGTYYHEVGREFARHDAVNHKQEEYVRGDVHTDTAENFFSIFKRGMHGVYQHCSEKHLHRYLAEFDSRCSNRAKLGVDDGERTARALSASPMERLTTEWPYGKSRPKAKEASEKH